MVKGYKDFLLILERNNINKIKKFADVPEIYNWAHETDENVSIWLANQMVELIKTQQLADPLNPEIDKKTFNLYLKDDLTTDKLVDVFKDQNPDDQDRTDTEYNKYIGDMVDWHINKFKEDFNYYFNELKVRHNSQLKSVLTYVNSPIHGNKPNINKLSFDDAVTLSNDWNREQEEKENGSIEGDEGTVIMTFPDGYYWFDLEKTYCEIEQERMGHCGKTTNGTTLLSLRKKRNSYITIGFNEPDNIFTQIKGKESKKPIDKYHPYIVELLIKLEINGFDSEHDESSDFSYEDLSKELFDKLEEENPMYIAYTTSEDEVDIEACKERFRDTIDGDMEYYGSIYPNVFFRHVDDDKFIEYVIENEVNNSSKDEMVEQYGDNYSELIEFIYEKTNENDIRAYLNKYIIDELETNSDLTDIDVKELEEKLDKDNEKDIDDLLIDKDYGKPSDLIRLIDDFDLINILVRYHYEKRYYNMLAEEYYENMYGRSDGEIEKGFVGYVQYSGAFDEDAFIEELLENEEDDWLIDTYGEE